MNIFVTGGSGFAGGHLIQALAPHHNVVAMARSDRSATIVAERGARPVRCSLESVTSADLEGIDVIVHAAAYVEEWGPLHAFEAINVAGTKRLVDAARKAGVQRFVHISTNATVINAIDQHDIDESYRPPTAPPFPYGATKAASEEAVLAANSERFITIALRPCFIWGPGDTTLLPVITEMAAQGRFMWLNGGAKLVSTTHIDNLVHAVSCALTRGRGGHAYFVADEGDVSLKEFITGLADTRGVTLPAMSAPGGLVRPLARVTEGAWNLFGIKSAPPLTRMAATLMSTAMTVRTDKAQSELAWQPVIARSEALASLGTQSPPN